jgi:hypothetical protein
MSNNDLFRYQLMLESAKVEISNFNDLKRIVNNLKSLIYSLEIRDDDWTKLIMQQWWILEEYFGVISSESEKSLSEPIIKKLNDVRLILFDLINQKFQESSIL